MEKEKIIEILIADDIKRGVNNMSVKMLDFFILQRYNKII